MSDHKKPSLGPIISEDAGDSSNQPFNMLSRRHFLASSCVVGASAAVASTLPLSGCSENVNEQIVIPKPKAPLAPKPPITANNFYDRYRNHWSWDDVTQTTHCTNCGSSHSCSFNVFTRNGKVIREEQFAQYPQTNPYVPDANPRGCQKGIVYSEMMYSKVRVTKPLKRKGERGGGEWEEISWDQALTEIADKVVKNMAETGPHSIAVDMAANVWANSAWIGSMALADMLDAPLLDGGAEVGDEQMGVGLTYGDAAGGRSSDDYFYSDLILIWNGNPVYTQIPNMHFINEARYNGAQVVTIAPDFNASSIHTDLWVPIKPGTDVALGLSICHVLVSEGLHDVDLIREQTDLSCLVRLDTQKFLLESDLKKRGSKEQMYQYDLVEQEFFETDHNDLTLKKRKPALEGEFEVELLDGVVKVAPVFELLKKELNKYSPEEASKICKVSPKMIRKLAHMMADSKAASNVVTTAPGKNYHGDLMQRVQILAFVLSGHLGEKGAGFHSAQYMLPDGGLEFIKNNNLVKEMRWKLAKKHGLSLAKDLVMGKKNFDSIVHRLYEEGVAETKILMNSTMFWNVHAGLMADTLKEQDPDLARSLESYLADAEKNNMAGLADIKRMKPKVLFQMGSNSLRRVRRGNKIQEVLYPKLDLIVNLDVRMSSSAMYADYVLPCVGPYERNESIGAISAGANPFHHMMNAAVEPVGESTNEWIFACRLAKKIEKACQRQKFSAFTSRRGNKRRLDNCYDVMTQGGKYTERDTEKLSKVLIENSSNLGGISWEDFKEAGFVRFTDVGHVPIAAATATDINPNETITPFTWHTHDKKPWFTKSGRVQFYIDHDWYIAEGEQLPIYKAPPKAGGDYPVALTGGHTRWSIHAMQRADPIMLRLQRGEPIMWINSDDAKERNIVDNDKVKVWNDLDTFTIMSKVSPQIRPGQSVIYHGWENYQFDGGNGYRCLLASPLKPLEFAVDQPFQKPKFLEFQPGMNDRDTRINYEKA